MPRTSERGGPRTRARIAETAGRMFLERGYDAVTVAEVAREAGVSSVTVFNHFPRKEDLFFDRADEAAEVLRTAVRDRTPDADAVTALRDTVLGLIEDRLPLSGVDERSVPFFKTVAESPSLLARAREIAWDLQRTLAEELEADSVFRGDATLLAAFFVTGYATVLTETARRAMAGDRWESLVPDHRNRCENLFAALRGGVAPNA